MPAYKSLWGGSGEVWRGEGGAFSRKPLLPPPIFSKTASSASSVGASFENTTAIMATMQESTRESSKNIGTALKSIISRYGELKSDPRSLMDSEGEELSLNKVDKALQSVGITLQTADGQFRDFDDVIIELASHWKELDSISQRY